jgi:16S rRNA (guanine527-N7)-methyltransferase
VTEVDPGSVDALRKRVDPWVEGALRRSAELGFLGGMAVEDQVDHALGFVYVAESEVETSPGRVADLGSGGGVPGLILLSCLPVSHFVFVDSNDRRTEFLSDVVEGLGMAVEAEVLRSRAEEAGRDPALREQFDLVTSRSFGAPGVAAECGAPLLRVGGLMIVSEPPADQLEADRWPSAGLEQLGLQPSARVRFNEAFGYQVLVKTRTTPERYPRRVGIPAKRPLF